MTVPLRVLIVEDSETDAKLVSLALRATGRDVHLERVQDAEAMRDALAQGTFDLVISDWSMPRFSAPEALAVLQSTALDVPFIIVSGTVGEETAVEAMRAGAQDYVLKDNLARLAPAVERELRERESRVARGRADDALRSQDARFRALVERSDDGITLTDRDGRLLYVSPGARRIFGFDHGGVGDLIGSSVHPSDRAHVQAHAARLRATPSASDQLEFRIVRPDGATRWLEATIVNRLDDPAVAAVVVNSRDITEKKLALDELRESEMRFRRLWERGIVGIAIANTEGAFVDANDALLTIVGYSRDDLRAGKVRWRDMTPPEGLPATDAAVALLRLNGSAGPWEKEYIRKDGTRVPVLVGLASLSPTRTISVVVDLSAQRGAEAERRLAEQALHETEAKLRQAQKMEAIGRLAGGVAHDFNNLLSVILSYSEFAFDALKVGDPLRDDIGEICKAGHRAAELTSQLLMFSRQQVLEPKVVDLNDVLANMDRMLRRVLGEGIALASLAARPLGLVRVDQGSFEQVVMNLAVNARDAMPEGGQLTVETSNVVIDEAFARTHDGVRPGPHVMLAVTDTGTGMDDATQLHIFEPFFTTKAVGKGTGLGLSSVLGVVQQSNGVVWAESELGKGSTFRVYLPRVA